MKSILLVEMKLLHILPGLIFRNSTSCPQRIFVCFI